MGNLEIYQKKYFSRTFKNPKKFRKSEKNWNSRYQNFETIDLIILPNRSNRSNRKKSLNRLDRFIGQRINTCNSTIIKHGAVQKKTTHLMVSEKALLPHSQKYSSASRCQIEQYRGLQDKSPPQIFLLKTFDIVCCCTRQIWLKTKKMKVITGRI